MKTITINETTFDAEVLQSDKPALVDLWAPWCGPCHMVAPVVEEIAAEHNGRFKVTKVNVDENPKLVQRFGVRAIPTLLFFKDGELRDQLIGTAIKNTIVTKLEALAA
jgi:thioredoxin